MLFRNAVYHLSLDLSQLGTVDEKRATILAKELGVPRDTLVKTAEELYFEEITLDDVEARMSSVGDFINTH